MYVFGFVGGYFLVRWLAKKRRVHLPKDVLQELISYLVVGVILGGRLGYVLFYNLPFYLANPLEIFAVWHGGMSFHGGLIGASLMGWWFTRKRGLAFYPLADLCGRGAHRVRIGALGKFYQRRVVWSSHTRPLGGNVSARRPRAASSLAALRGVPRRFNVIFCFALDE